MSPELYLPNRAGGILSSLYLPQLEGVPAGEPFAIAHEFSLAALDSDQWAYQVHRPHYIWAMQGADSDAAGFQVQMLRHSPRGRFRLFRKYSHNLAVLGSGEYPRLIKKPILIDAGESVTILVRNLSRAAQNASIWVALWTTRVIAEEAEA